MKTVSFLFFIALGLMMVTVRGQEDDDNDFDDSSDYRDYRQASNVRAYAYVPPSKSCARVSYGRSYCGGFSAGDRGGCDSYCLQEGYPLSYCRPNHCLCHRGKDLGRECETSNGK